MPWNPQQRRIVRDSLFAFVVCAGVLGAGYMWLSLKLFGLDAPLGIGDRIAFALKMDIGRRQKASLTACGFTHL
ncbi:hypothetical protein [Cupriavidus necator]